MTEYTKKEWIVEHDWKCIHCGYENLGREDKCVNCGKPIDETHKEIIPTDMSYENRVKDKKVEKKLSGNPDWICHYCKHRERAENKSCTECGSEKIKKIVNSGEATSPNSTMFQEKKIPEPKPNEEKKKEYKKPTPSPYRAPQAQQPKEQPRDSKLDTRFRQFIYAALAILACFGFFLIGKEIYDYYRWIPTNAKVIGVNWTASTTIRTRTVLSGHGWRHNEPNHVFNETCHQEISGYHNCNPYSCNPHRESYSCNCRDVCTPVESCRTVCSSTGRRSSSCREVCSTRNSCRTSCSTCYRTVTDTCYRRCPDYDDMCDYEYPSWRGNQTLTTSGRDHTITYPTVATNLLNCGSDPEQLYISSQSNTSCKQTVMTFIVQFDVENLGIRNKEVETLQEFNRFQINSIIPAFYNQAGNFTLNN